MTDDLIYSAQVELEHLCDGPLTPFVLIARAAQMAERKKFDHATVANALYQALRERGWVVSGETIGESIGS